MHYYLIENLLKNGSLIKEVIEQPERTDIDSLFKIYQRRAVGTFQDKLDRFDIKEISTLSKDVETFLEAKKSEGMYDGWPYKRNEY